jgi:hypothetical protein
MDVIQIAGGEGYAKSVPCKQLHHCDVLRVDSVTRNTVQLFSSY